MAKNKVAILGGTFNPVHNGHIAMADAALTECGLSKVVFLPNGNPPHKADSDMADARKRFEMVLLAVDGREEFEVSDYEIKRDKPSYTIETLPYLKSVYGDDIYYIIGADSLYTLHLWKDYRRLMTQCSFIVADRNCGSGSDLERACELLREQGADIITLSMPRIDVTSTFIRECVSSNTDFSRYVPEKVFNYIKNNNLYQPCSEDKNDY